MQSLETMLETTYVADTAGGMVSKPETMSPMIVLAPQRILLPFLDPIEQSQYRSLVGCANWLVTLGRFDIAYATNTISRAGMQPQEEHVKRIIKVFGYLNKLIKPESL